MKNIAKSQPEAQARPFILVIEGIDFSGKTTLAHHIQGTLLNQGYRVKLLHDPKGSKNAQVIWETILAVQEMGANPTTEFFLFLAARNELIHQEALVDDVHVIVFDRFIFSTIAYQLTDKPQSWEPFLSTHRFFSGLMPDLCIYCDLDFNTFQLRNQARSKQDLFDQMSKNRFKAIQLAYEKALQLHVCPFLRVHHLEQDDFLELMKNITDRISNQSSHV
ncbi:dTMP kinase [Candidatus Cardinium hertigii]|jgi:dTMP kinase|uniref:Thymidylate kinase n=1 Tax=Candidatus Cardinium hertigii TaxID=247481 RepID=A0A3N2QC81_9BACT|nr:dTMP kinase [Candidatus Cardinium hertigii]ROT47279.1 dTMP kinase [Candidatus Cardinium hertigii]